MQLSHAVLVLAIGTGILATPGVDPSKFEKRTTAVDFISYSIGTLANTISANINTLSFVAASVGQNANAQLSIVATYNFNIQAIVSAINSAAKTISANTVAGATALTAPEVQILITDISIATYLVNEITATLTYGAEEFVQATKNAVASEVVALEFAIAALASPLNTYAIAVIINAQNSVIGNINALVTAVNSFNAATNQFISIGNLFAPPLAT